LDLLKIRKYNATWNTSTELSTLLTEELRIDLSGLLAQTSVENIQESLSFFHRNTKEARTLKWLLTKKGKQNG
jgi:hypothetical protein